MLQESQAKRFLVDSIETTFPVLKVMQEYKLLAPYFSPHLARYSDEAKEKTNNGLVYWATDRESYIGLAYNTNVIQGSAVPKSFEDLLKPELKGKIGFATSDTGARVIAAMLASKGAEFVQKLKNQQITLHSVSGRAILDMVISGELGISPSVFLSHSRVSIVQGSADQMGGNGSRADQCRRRRPAAQCASSSCRFAVRRFFAQSPKGKNFSANSVSIAPSISRRLNASMRKRGMSAAQYEKENEKWEKLLKDIGKK